MSIIEIATGFFTVFLPNLFQGKKGSLSFNSSTGPKTSVFPAMLKTFGTPFFIGSAVKIIYDTLAVFNPQFMKLMIGYVESQPVNGTTKPGEDPQEEWKGYFYACLLLVVTVFQVSCLKPRCHTLFQHLKLCRLIFDHSPPRKHLVTLLPQQNTSNLLK